MEIDILLLLSDKDNYYKYNKYIKDYTLTKECNIIIRDINARRIGHEVRSSSIQFISILYFSTEELQILLTNYPACSPFYQISPIVFPYLFAFQL